VPDAQSVQQDCKGENNSNLAESFLAYFIITNLPKPRLVGGTVPQKL
jgi:hypothetical protein